MTYCIHLCRLLVDGLNIIHYPAVKLTAQSAVLKSTVEFNKILIFAVGNIKAMPVRIVGAGGIRHSAAGEFKLERDGLIDFLEFNRVCFELLGADCERLFVGSITRCLKAIDADIVDRTSAGESFV